MTQLKSAPGPTGTAGFTAEEADTLRQRYGTALQHIILPSREHAKPGHPFYMTFAQALRYREVGTDSDIAVAAVGFVPKSPVGSLYLNVPVCSRMKLREFSGVVVHELLHVILGHVHLDTAFRRHHPELFAIAIDLVVNQTVLKDGYALPFGKGYFPDDPDQLVDPVTLDSVEAIVGKRPPAEQSVEFYCDWLLENLPPQAGPSDGGDSGEDEGKGSGSQRPGPQASSQRKRQYLYDQTDHENSLLDEEGNPLSEAEREIVKRTVAQVVKEAVDNAGGLGQLPGHLQRACQQVIAVLEPKVSLEHLLSSAMGGAGRMEPYLRRNRLNRYEQPGKLGYKPSLALGIVADVSGSVDNAELSYAFGVCRKLAHQAGLEVYIQQASDGNVEDIQPLDAVLDADGGKRLGYGGTDMRPSVLAFQEEIEQGGACRVGAIFVLTDGELDSRSRVLPHEVDVPVYWLSYRSQKVPFAGPYAGEWYWFSPQSGEVKRLD
jgi:predicted metal-dependent peptidase